MSHANEDPQAGSAHNLMVGHSDGATSHAKRRHLLLLAGLVLAIIAAISLHVIGEIYVLKMGFGEFSLSHPITYVVIALLLGIGVLKLKHLLAFLHRK